MRLILVGPPGCGKGTQATLLSRRHGVEHIGTGDVLRAAAAANTPLGQKVKPYLEAGKLAPDELVNEVIADRFERADRPAQFVLDGYPRTLVQGKAFDALLHRYGLDIDRVLLLTVSDEEIVRRLAGRWSCPKSGCKATYHVQSNPPKVPGVCDNCGTALVQRGDDLADTVRGRLEIYHRDTEELDPYYRVRGLLREVPAEGEIEKVYENIMREIPPC